MEAPVYYSLMNLCFWRQRVRWSTPSPPLTSFSAAMAIERAVEEFNLRNAVDASEAETVGDGEFTGQGNKNQCRRNIFGGMYCWVNMIRRFSSAQQLM